MRAFALRDLGPAAHLDAVSLPRPVPGPGEVRVRVQAAALNPLDAKISTGTMRDWFPVALPYVPGTDFAGSIDALGEGVSDLAIGDEVFGRSDPTKGGALADALVVAASRVAHRPLHVSPKDIACLSTPGGIAWQVLAPALASPEAGAIFILGDGAVACAAMQIGGRDVRKLSCASELDNLDEPVCLFDIAGGNSQEWAVKRLPAGSHVISIAAPVDAAVAAAQKLRADFAVLQTERDQLEVLARLAADDVLRPRIDHVIPHSDLPDAFARYIARSLTGKIVIQGEKA